MLDATLKTPGENISAEALRSRRYRERKRNRRCGNIEIGLWISPWQRTALVRLGFLANERRDDPDSVATAVDELVTLAPTLSGFVEDIAKRAARAAV